MPIKGLNLSPESVKDAMRSAAVSRVWMDLKRGIISEQQAQEQIQAIRYDFDRDKQEKEILRK